MPPAIGYHHSGIITRQSGIITSQLGEPLGASWRGAITNRRDPVCSRKGSVSSQREVVISWGVQSLVRGAPSLVCMYVFMCLEKSPHRGSSDFRVITNKHTIES